MKLDKGIKVRNFNLGDTEALSEFQKENTMINFPDVKVDIRNFRNNLLLWSEKEPDGIKVLEKEGEIIGYIWMNTKYNTFRKKRYGLIRHLFVKKGYRGMGLAKKLIMVAEEYFKRKRVKYIQLKVTLTNKAALSLYKKADYREKRVVMEKQL